MAINDEYYFRETSRLWEEREKARERHKKAVTNEEAIRRVVAVAKEKMISEFNKLDDAAKRYKAAWAAYNDERLIGNCLIKLYEKDAEVERGAKEKAREKSKSSYEIGDYAASKRYWLAVEAHQLCLDECKNELHEAVRSNEQAFAKAQSVPRYSDAEFQRARREFFALCKEHNRALEETRRCWVDFSTLCDEYYRLGCKHRAYRSEHVE